MRPKAKNKGFFNKAGRKKIKKNKKSLIGRADAGMSRKKGYHDQHSKNSKAHDPKSTLSSGDIVVGTYIKANKALAKKKICAYIIPRFLKDPLNVYIRKEGRIIPGNGDIVVCNVKEMRGRSVFGEIKEILGRPDDAGMDLTAMVKQSGWETEFSPKSLDMAARCDKPITDSDKLGRKNFTHDMVITIDSQDTRDFDDGVCLKVTDEGYELGVHIADVANYVQEGSAIDRDALKKGVSLYLPDRTYPMIPERLSNGICSLIENEERLTLSCVIRIDRSGKVISYDIYEGYIRVYRRMTYKQVDEILENALSIPNNDKQGSTKASENDSAIETANLKNSDPEAVSGYKEYSQELIEMLLNMKELARILRKNRMRSGAVEFNIPKNTVELDCYGNCIGLQKEPSYISGSIIEEFMLLANECVAKRYKQKEVPFLYRIHEKPVSEKVEEFICFLGETDYGFPGDPEKVSSRDYARLMDRIKGTDDEKLISMMALRTMSQAVYSDEPCGHFALAKEDYSHFTSPIRRYPDLQIHRIIHDDIRGRLNDKRIEGYASRLSNVAYLCSMLERQSADIERKSIKIKEAQYMMDFLGEEFSGIISSVTDWGFYVELENGAEGLVHVRTLRDDRYEHDESEHVLYGLRTGKNFRLGEKVSVRIISVNKDMGRIDLKPVGNRITG